MLCIFIVLTTVGMTIGHVIFIGHFVTAAHDQPGSIIRIRGWLELS